MAPSRRTARTHQIRCVDVFTKIRFRGCSLAVVLRAGDLTPRQMQRIANEFNLPETTFVTGIENSKYSVRIFTRNTEIPIAGHPSIGTAYVLFNEGLMRTSNGPVTTVYQQTAIGSSRIDVSTKNRKVQKVMMTQQKPVFGEIVRDLGTIKKALRIESADVELHEFEPQIVSTGLRHLLVPMKDSGTISSKISPDLDAVKALEEEFEVTGLGIFTFKDRKRSVLHLRFFAPSIGILEDPAAGSAAGALGAYLSSWTQHFEGERKYMVKQGSELNRLSTIQVRVCRDGESLGVMIGGQAVTVMKGELLV